MGRRLQGGEATTAMGPGRGPRSGQAELLAQAKGLPVFRVGLLRSRPGTHLGWRETFRFPGITRLSEPGSPERGPGSCIIVSAGSPVDPKTLQSARANAAETAGAGGSREAETGAAHRSCESVHPCPKPCLRACSGPGLGTDTGRTGGAGDRQDPGHTLCKVSQAGSLSQSGVPGTPVL